MKCDLDANILEGRQYSCLKKVALMSYLVLRKYCLFEGILKQIVTVCILCINFITLNVVDTLVFSSSEGCQPYVLLGTHSSKQNIKSAAKQSLLNNNTTMANSGVDGRAARHMV